MKENKHHFCLICASTDLLKLNRYSAHYLVKCKYCGLIFCESISTVKELNGFFLEVDREQGW
jgi:uncharacterized Zn finger protein